MKVNSTVCKCKNIFKKRMVCRGSFTEHFVFSHLHTHTHTHTHVYAYSHTHTHMQ